MKVIRTTVSILLLIQSHGMYPYVYTFDNLTQYPLFVSITGVAAISSKPASVFGDFNPDKTVRAQLILPGDSVEFHGTGWELGICLDSVRVKFAEKETDAQGKVTYKPTGRNPITGQLMDPNLSIYILPNTLYQKLGTLINEYAEVVKKSTENAMSESGPSPIGTTDNSTAYLAANAAYLVADLGLTIATGGIPVGPLVESGVTILSKSVDFGFNLFKNGTCRNRTFRIIEAIEKPAVIKKGQLIAPAQKKLKVITSE